MTWYVVKLVVICCVTTWIVFNLLGLIRKALIVTSKHIMKHFGIGGKLKQAVVIDFGKYKRDKKDDKNPKW